MKAHYVFFFAYIQPKPKEGEGIWSAVDELVKINCNPLVAPPIMVQTNVSGV